MTFIRDFRSKKAVEADQLQEQLLKQRRWVFQVTATVTVLIEIGLWYWGADTWVQIVVPIFWIGLLLHNATLCILHELWELNDQLAGRKAELRALVSREDP
ncbi:hypothetical protein [Sinorhizobium medicae]|uniref:hypothetical protein n=1 Tax=Sinorhizobium medicae TaxID=110321 RepID=UPI001295C5FC|nr:hypothetical protein [Sinorhizobium medicae]MQV46519.1 hypothetical protein [Sinorhizobium medicae]MQV55965.1 hypothetical protein [Sinorhizobium medicae]MQV72020.1 hypothetical protein [Sinorhizobium medicae]